MDLGKSAHFSDCIKIEILLYLASIDDKIINKQNKKKKIVDIKKFKMKSSGQSDNNTNV